MRITFYSEDDNGFIIRTCAPLDYGPSRRANDKTDRFHMWDYDSDKRPHTLPLVKDQIIKLEVLEQTFDPRDIITWNLKSSPWFIKRDWGEYS
ncbi:hypothetical protein HZC07_01280 [Candidatus Micrarchaeota archaeon]|nr:hypothetical protein [Candidatus Micrarchaeota archaeon]